MDVVRKLMVEVGYLNGCDVKFGDLLVVNFDIMGGGIGEKLWFDWLIW